MNRRDVSELLTACLVVGSPFILLSVAAIVTLWAR